MPPLGNALKQALRIGVGMLIATPFLGLFAMMFLLPPVAVVWESIDMFRMSANAAGQVTDVTFDTGGMETSRARIEYAFTVAGRRFVSDRYLPGFAGNSGTWTGGAAVGNDFPVGRTVTIHYRPSDPTLCALEYGWFKWSIALSSVWIGLAIIGLACSRVRRGAVATALWGAGVASVAYGACELFVGPSVVRVDDLHWHALAWCGALAAASLFAWCKKKFPGPANDSERSYSRKNYRNHVASQHALAEAADRECSTPYLVFELLCVMALLTIIVLSSYQGVLTFAEAAIRGLILGMADVSQVIATVLVFIAIGVTVTMYVALSCAVVTCFRKVTRRIAWHRSRAKRRDMSEIQL